MRPRPVTTLVVLLAVAALSVASLAQVFVPRAAAPHDTGAKFDAEAFWLPKHREVVASSRRAYPVAPPVARAAAKLKFKGAKRISSDILGPPDGSIPTAQAETQTEPYVSVNPENPDHMVAGWQETRFTDGGARSLGVGVSTNGGRTWTDALLPGLTVADGGEWNRASDPWPVFGPDGIVYYNSLLVNGSLAAANAIGVSVSRDGGFTWGPLVEIVRDQGDFNDKNSMVVDTMPDSRYRGRAYVAWDVNVSQGGNFVSQRMVISRSTNEGASWTKPTRIRDEATNIGIILRVAPDGTLYAIWAGAGTGDATLSVFFAKSTNGGKSFKTPVKIASLLSTGVAGFRSGSILPSFDVDPNTGDMFVVWPDARFTGSDQAALIVSRDGGDSWTAPARVSDSDEPAMTVGVATNAAGELVVGYYVLRSGSGTVVDYVMNRSSDGGNTFEAAARVTRKSFDARTAARAGGNLSIFLGDYVGLAGTDTGFLAVLTQVTKRSKLTAGRQPDIFGVVSR